MRLLVVCPPGGSFVIPVLQMFRGTLGLLRRGRLNLSMSICQQIRFSILLMFARKRKLVSHPPQTRKPVQADPRYQASCACASGLSSRQQRPG